MKWFTILVVPMLAACLILSACEEEEGGGAVQVEQIDGYKANLPPIPKIPRPNVPETFSDGSWSVYGLRKNLVKTILSNNGYTVHDLGKQVPANAIIDKAVELNADAIGLSALLVSTSKQMPLIVNELARRGLAYPVLIGGAAINRRFGRRILFLEDTGEPYAPGVFYCNLQ